VDSASELVKLYATKFDLLRTGGAAPKKASSGASAATVKALEELKEVINGHLKVRRKYIDKQTDKHEDKVDSRRYQQVCNSGASTATGKA
jgi:hypothetical protein